MEEKRHGSDSKHPEIHKPHITINPLQFGFMFFCKCVMGSVWYTMQNIMLWWQYSKCERVVCSRSNVNLAPWKDGTDAIFCDSFYRVSFRSTFQIRHVKVHLFAPYMAAQWLEVCYVLHVRFTCKLSCCVLIMQCFSLLCLFPFDYSTAVMRKPGESPEELITTSAKS